jgi:hypothetical protein
MMGTTRSIPLKVGGTHISRTDSRTRWEEIRHEFALLCCIFPTSYTTDWYLLLANEHTNMMPHQRREWLEKETKTKWSQYFFERESNRVYGRLTQSLRNHHLLIEEEEGIPV